MSTIPPDRAQQEFDRRLSSQEAIIRIDMRTQFMLEEIKAMKDVLGTKADTSVVVDLKSNLEKQMANVVAKSEFAPVMRVVYGLVAIILLTVIGAVLATVIIK